MAVLVTSMMPIELSQWLLAGNTPLTVVEDTREMTVIFVASRIAPVLLRAAINNLFTPGESARFLLQVPVPLLKVASSPLITTRVEPARVLLPERRTELEFTSEKNVPLTTPL